MNPLDASNAEHSLVTETDSRQTTEPVASNDDSRQTTAELVALDVGAARQTTPDGRPVDETRSPPIILHSHYKWDEGSLPADTFATLRASTAIIPECSTSPSGGRATDGAAGTNEPAPRELPSAKEAPVFGAPPPPPRTQGSSPPDHSKSNPRPIQIGKSGDRTPRVSPSQPAPTRSGKGLSRTGPSNQTVRSGQPVGPYLSQTYQTYLREAQTQVRQAWARLRRC